MKIADNPSWDTPSSSPPNPAIRVLGRKHARQESPSNSDLTGMGRPWRLNNGRHYLDDNTVEPVCTLSRRNHKVYADLGLTTPTMVRQLTLLDTGVGSNFVRADTLPEGLESLLGPGEILTIADANGRPSRTYRTVTLVVRLETRTIKCKFIVCERLVAPVILCCDFNDKFVEAVYPRRKVVELDDGTKVPIVRKPTARRADALPLPSEQEYDNEPGRVSQKRKVSRPVIMQSGTQVWVHVINGRTGLSILEPKPQLYAKHRVSLSNGVAHHRASRVQGFGGRLSNGTQTPLEEPGAGVCYPPSACHDTHRDAPRSPAGGGVYRWGPAPI